jgi:hypothetical protein
MLLYAPEGARLLEDRDADHGVIKFPADTLGALLRAALPWRGRVTRDRLLYQPQRLNRRRIRHDHGLQK